MPLGKSRRPSPPAFTGARSKNGTRSRSQELLEIRASRGRAGRRLLLEMTQIAYTIMAQRGLCRSRCGDVLGVSAQHPDQSTEYLPTVSAVRVAVRVERTQACARASVPRRAIGPPLSPAEGVPLPAAPPSPPPASDLRPFGCSKSAICAQAAAQSALAIRRGRRSMLVRRTIARSSGTPRR